MRSGQIVDLAPDGTDLGGLAAVETDTLVENAAAHCLFLDIVVVTLHHSLALVGVVFLKLLLGHLGQRLKIFLADLAELLGAPMLVGRAGACDGICLVVALVMDILAELVVVDLVAVLTFHFLASLFHQLDLGEAMFLDFRMGYLEGFEKLSLRNLVHLTLDHHDVVVGGTDHQLDVGILDLLESRVDHPFAVHAGHAHLGDGAVERYVAACDCGRSCDTCQCVGGIVLVGRVKCHVDESVSVVVIGEKRAEHAVNQTRGKNLVVAGASLTFEEASRIASDRRIFLFIFNCEGHEVYALAGLAGRTNGGKKHRVAHAHLYRSIGLLGKFACLDRDLTSVGQRDGFLYWIHLKFRYCFSSLMSSDQRVFQTRFLT